MKFNTIVNNLQTKMKYLLIFSACLVSQAASAAPIFNFEMSGNTVYKPFSLTNMSTNGESIGSFTLDMVGLGYVFDTIDRDGLTRYSKKFTPRGTTGDETGVQSTSGAVDNTTVLNAFFNDFDAGEQFLFDIDVDLLGKARSPVYGNNLIGALLTVNFSDGSILSGLLGAVTGKSTSTSLQLFGNSAPQGSGNNLATLVNSPSTLSLLALFPMLLVMKRSKKRHLNC